MSIRLFSAAAGVLIAVGSATTANADPAPVPPPAVPAPAAAEAAPVIAPVANTAPAPDAAPPADNGAVASDPPGIAKTLDGRTLTVAGKDETLLAIPPLTTSLGARDWLAGGTFTGSTTGDVAGGTLEVGYQIGCGVEMNQIRLGGTEGTSVNTSSVTFPTQGAIDVRIRPGTVINAPVMTKEFKGAKTRVIVKDIHVRVDGCVGKSNLRSYAILTSSTPHTQDVVAYYGVPKVF